MNAVDGHSEASRDSVLGGPLGLGRYATP